MTGQLKLTNGAIGAPALSWTTEPTSGLYRAGAGDFRYSVTSTDVIQFLVSGTRFPLATLFAAGTAASPGISFTGDPDTGFASLVANQISVSAAGAATLTIDATGVQVVASGSAAAPPYSFVGDLNTGVYRVGADNLGFSAGSTLVFNIQPTEFDLAVRLLAASGTAASPEYGFTSDPDNGMYLVGANAIGFSAGGTLRAQVDASGVTVSSGVLFLQDGAVGAPGLSFSNDSNTGLYRIGADDLGFSTGGTLRAEITSGGVFNYGGREIGYRNSNTNNQGGTTYTLAQDDGGRLVYMTNGGATTVTVPQLVADTIITVVNNSAGSNCTLSQGSGVTEILSGVGTTGNRTLGVRGTAQLWWASATSVFVSGAGVS
jgi:hypothetical protein